jgi:hypothetical protein
MRSFRNGGDLEEEACVEPEAQTIHGGEGGVRVEGGGRLQASLDRLHTEDGREPVGGVCTQECACGPGTLADVRREEAEATGAEAHGRGGQAIDVLPVQDRALQLLCGEAVGGGVGALRQQADCSDRGCVRPCALAAEVERRDHGLTQGAHGVSPFGRRGVEVRRKTS